MSEVKDEGAEENRRACQNSSTYVTSARWSEEVMFYLLDEQWFTEDSGPFAFFLKQTQTLPHVFLQ